MDFNTAIVLLLVITVPIAGTVLALGAMMAYTRRQNQLAEEARQREDAIVAVGDSGDPVIGDIPNWVLGPLAPMLRDTSVTEIMVNRHDQIFIERNGKIGLTDLTFTDDDQLVEVIRRIAGHARRRIDESSPLVDARLADGSRVNAVLHPVATSGPSLTIRKFVSDLLNLEDLVDRGSLNIEMAEYLNASVRGRKNILVSGGTGSGKTTLLNVLLSMISPKERIVTIEDAAELRVVQPNVVSLESRPPNLEGSGEITIRRLLINALRMRPDRIIVGECRGPEALDMLQAMNTGHDGSLTTIHANSPRDAIARLEMLILMAGMELPSLAIRQQIAAAVDTIVQAKRMADGSRKIVRISQVPGMKQGNIVVHDVWRFKATRTDEHAKIIGEFVKVADPL